MAAGTSPTPGRRRGPGGNHFTQSGEISSQQSGRRIASLLSVLSARISNWLSRPRWLATRVTRLHGFWLRRTRGRLASRNLLVAPRQRVLALTTIGRKSGRPRTTALGYLHDGEDFAVVASNSGLDRAPAWWMNLKANPDAEIDAAGERVRVRARAATPEEQERLWPRFLEQYAGFDGYQQLTSRKIPVVLLERVALEADSPR
jgi:deazaflavin-dependent oxidoreductase (nitroreductase family)